MPLGESKSSASGVGSAASHASLGESSVSAASQVLASGHGGPAGIDPLHLLSSSDDEDPVPSKKEKKKKKKKKRNTSKADVKSNKKARLVYTPESRYLIARVFDKAYQKYPDIMTGNDWKESVYKLYAKQSERTGYIAELADKKDDRLYKMLSNWRSTFKNVMMIEHKLTLDSVCARLHTSLSSCSSFPFFFFFFFSI